MAAPVQTFQFLRGQTRPKTQIIAIGGGKGGVGKSFVSSSLAVFLGHLGKKTIIVDLDVGAANLHTTLGTGLSSEGINEFLSSPSDELQAFARPTQFPNLSLISGSSDIIESADISSADRSRLMSGIFNLNADYVVLDLSAGTHGNTLDFFLTSTHQLVVFTPEPSSIENAYRFLKAAFYRRLRRFEHQLGLESLLAELMSQKNQHGIKSPADLLRIVNRESPEAGRDLSALMANLNFEIILNQVRSHRDAEVGPSIQNVCSRYFGIPCGYLGHIDHDNAVWQALRKRRHLILEYPNSRAYAQLLGIARRMVSSTAPQVMVG